MARFQLHSLTKPPSAELWKTLALSSLRITEAVRVCDFENRKEPQVVEHVDERARRQI